MKGEHTRTLPRCVAHYYLDVDDVKKAHNARSTKETMVAMVVMWFQAKDQGKNEDQDRQRENPNVK